MQALSYVMFFVCRMQKQLWLSEAQREFIEKRLGATILKFASQEVNSLENSWDIRSRNLWGISFKYHPEVPQKQLFLSLSRTLEGETVKLQIPVSSSRFPYFSPQRILEPQKGKMQRSRLWADTMPNSVVNPAFLVSYFMTFSPSLYPVQ